MLIPVIAVIGIFIGLFEIISKFCLYYLSCKMTKNLRKEVYESMIHQPLEFFNKKENSTGNLIGILSQEIKSINTITLTMYFLLFQGVVAMIAGLAISLAYSLKIGFIACGIIPVILLLLFMHAKQIRVDRAKDSDYAKNVRVIISDSILNHSTVSSLANDQILVDRYFVNEIKSWQSF